MYCCNVSCIALLASHIIVIKGFGALEMHLVVVVVVVVVVSNKHLNFTAVSTYMFSEIAVSSVNTYFALHTHL